MTWRKSRRSMANGNCAEVGDWRKSRASVADGACAEVGSDYRKPSRSGAENCAEVASGVRVRDTKDRAGTVLTFPAAAWRAFTASPDAALKRGTP